MPDGPARRAGRIARVGARYGFGFVFGRRFLPRRRREEPERVGTRLRLSLEELGPTFAELGRFLGMRRDLIPPDITTELARARVLAKPIAFPEARAYVERELGNTLERLFLEFYEALTPGGYLVLGRVETILGRARTLFRPVNTRERVYRKPL